MLNELIAAIGTGGIGAAFGSVVGAASKYANQRLELKRYSMEIEHTYKMQVLQIEADKWAAEQKLLITREEGSWTALDSAIKAEGNITNVSTGVNNIRALWRIILTALLWTGVMVVWTFGTSGDAITKQVLHTLILCASTATFFWYGSKAVTSQHK